MRAIYLGLCGMTMAAAVLALDADAQGRPRARVAPAAPTPAPEMWAPSPMPAMAPMPAIASMPAMAPMPTMAPMPAMAAPVAALHSRVAALESMRSMTSMRSMAVAQSAMAMQMAAEGLHSAYVPGARRFFSATMPSAWLQGDPGDSLYRSAREAINKSRFRDAAGMLRDLRRRYPRSGYVADALYWEAFALYRLGGDTDLKSALEVLRIQQKDHPQAATSGDGRALQARIQGVLARGGDRESAERITAEAEAITTPAPPAEPAEPAMPVTRSHGVNARTPRPPQPPRPPRARGSRDGCSGDDDDIKVAALNGLLQMDADRAVPILRKVLARRDSGSVCLRRKAVFLVAQHETSETADILLGTARTDPDGEVREQAVFWLSQVDAERAVPALDSILRSSTDAALQDKAIFALSQHSSPKATQALRGFAERDNVSDDVRAKAIFWLSQQNSADNAGFLRSLYGRLKSQDLKEKVLFSMSQIDDEASGRWLLDIAKNRAEPIEMRKKALFWLGQSDRTNTADLAALYANMPDREMKEQLIFSLSQRDDRASADKLIDIAKRDPDVELRKKALFWLGQSDDPRVAQVLGDILEER
jgi:TolA-binding protein/HEAT repeat protein